MWGVAIVVAAVVGWLGTSVARAAQPRQIPERVLRTLESQMRNAPREPKGGRVAENIREGMDMLPRPDAADVETVRRAGAIAEALLPPLEQQRGRPLSAWQRKQILGSALDLIEKLEGPQRKFLEDVAVSLDTDAERLAGIWPPGGLEARPLGAKVLAKLEERLGRKLRAGQIEALRDAEDARQAAVKPLADKFLRQVSVVSGVPDEQVIEILAGPGQ
jgi:hypothetical protein